MELETCFGDIRENTHDWKVNASVRESWRGDNSEKIFAAMWAYPETATAGSVATESTETVEERFSRLADKWSQDTGHVSSASDLINDPSYQEIISMGWSVLPCLLTDLQRNKRFWFPALAAITGIRPFDPSDYSSSHRMTAAWVKWGRRKGLI